MKFYWHRSTNFGDALNPYLYQKITGIEPEYIDEADLISSEEKYYCFIGSVINAVTDNAVVWGTGTAWNNLKVNPNADYRLVRGPITRNCIINSGGTCPELYGDPALLLPKFYTPTTSTKKYKLGIIPHYIERSSTKCFDRSVKIINVGHSTESIIDDIVSCDVIASSSLHGLIVADAYNIPNVWIKLSNGIIGDGSKYHDYLLSVGREITNPIMYNPRVITRFINKIIQSVPNYNINKNINKLQEDLLSSCPLLFK